MLNLLPDQHAAVEQKTKHSLLPILIVLFLVSYGIMTLLIVEQGRTIDSQRGLIRELFTDSAQLSIMKGKAFQQQYYATHPKPKVNTQAQAPSSQQKTPSDQAQTPSSQATPHDNAFTQKGKNRKKLPEKPPKDASDIADERRSSDLI